MTKFTNKTIWITGASAGIGEQLTYQLAKKGNRLIISARRKEALEKVKSNFGNDEINSIISGKKKITSELVEQAVKIWPVNERDFYIISVF